MQALRFRPGSSLRARRARLDWRNSSRGGYTLIEILVAAALALLLMAGTVTLFGMVSESISKSQSITETADRVRATQMVLQNDLKFASVIGHAVPTFSPRDERGYFEYVEGPGPSFNYDDNGTPTDPSDDSVTRLGVQPVNSIDGGLDTSVGDVDDFIMFTARSYGEPYIGRFAFFNSLTNQVETTTVQSQTAEVAWFLRGTTLYRRVLLVLPNGPDADQSTPEKEPVLTMGMGSAFSSASFYSINDVSVHQEGGSLEPRANWGPAKLVPNSLGDLSRREYRFAHDPVRQLGRYPHIVAPNAGLGSRPASPWWGQMALPTLEECSDAAWPLPYYGDNTVDPSNLVQPVSPIDYWLEPAPWPEIDSESNNLLISDNGSLVNGQNIHRIAQDVILQNVISFDVKMWDPGAPIFIDGNGLAVMPGDPGYRELLAPWLAQWANSNPQVRPPAASFGAYVDLFYARGFFPANAANLLPLAGPGDPRSGLMANNFTPATFDTWSDHWESDGIDQDDGGSGPVDEGTDGVDDFPWVGGVDDASERETAPPYNGALKSIQIKIRVFEPGSRQIREVTIVQDFVS